jgi:hypothetical protein
MTLATPARSLLLLVLAATPALAQCDAPSSCMPPQACPYTSSSVVTFPNGGQLVIHRLHDPSTCAPPPGPGATSNSFFDVFAEISYTGPEASGTVDALTDGLLILRHLATDPLGDHYETEFQGMAVVGPGGLHIRESPSRPSLGQTTIRATGGPYQIDSFFDVFTELSLDDGQTWIPSDNPSHQTATNQPTAVHPSTWGALKFIYR